MKLPHRRQFLHLAAVAAAVPAVSRITWAQAYPTQPVRLIVGFPAGGSASDIVARLMGQWLSEPLGQQFVVEIDHFVTAITSAAAIIRRTAPHLAQMAHGEFKRSVFPISANGITCWTDRDGRSYLCGTRDDPSRVGLNHSFFIVLAGGRHRDQGKHPAPVKGLPKEGEIRCGGVGLEEPSANASRMETLLRTDTSAGIWNTPTPTSSRTESQIWCTSAAPHRRSDARHLDVVVAEHALPWHLRGCCCPSPDGCCRTSQDSLPAR